MKIKAFFLSNLLALGCSLPAGAAVYTFSSTDSGAIPQGGTVFSSEQTITGIAPTISSVELVLTFNDSTSLLGTSSGIQGHLILGTSSTSPYVNFYPVATSASGSQRIYDVTFSGTAGSPGTGFHGLNPNSTWGLVLWDNSNTGFENGLLGWSLEITAVPEPLNSALALFAGLAVVGSCASWYFKRRRHGWRACFRPLFRL